MGLGELSASFWILLGLGILSIAAAIKYTVGKTAYGYRGLGDLFVFLFFGWVGVVGTNYLHTGVLNPWLLLPATSVGLFAVGVLNLNNMRDHVNDARSNKRTLVVWMGFNKAKLYHLSLISLGWMTMLIFAAYHFRDTWHYLFLLALPIFVLNVRWVLNHIQACTIGWRAEKSGARHLLLHHTHRHWSVDSFLEEIQGKDLSWDWQYLPLIFKRPAKTSRDVLLQKPTWYLRVRDNNGAVGLGEVSMIEGLSVESLSNIEVALRALASGHLKSLEKLPAFSIRHRNGLE